MNIELFSFFTLAFIIAVTPGPSIVYVVSNSLRYGTKAGIISTLGVNSGSIVAILIAAFGLSSLLEFYPNSIPFIQIVGGFYIIYLAVLMWPHGQTVGVTEQSLSQKSHWNLFKIGFITSVLNPKDILFYTAFIPAFIPQSARDGSYELYFLFLAFSFMVIGFVTKSGFAIFSGYTKGALDSRNTIRMNYFSATILGVLGVYLVSISALSMWL